MMWLVERLGAPATFFLGFCLVMHLTGLALWVHGYCRAKALDHLRKGIYR